MDIFTSYLNNSPNSVLLETVKTDCENYQSFLFINPVNVLTIFSLDEVKNLFDSVEKYLSQGYYLAGYCSYELGYHFEKITNQKQYSFPLAWFGVYEQAFVFNHRTGRWNNTPPIIHCDDEMKMFQVDDIKFSLSKEKSNVSLEEYSNKIQSIKHHIAEGDVYQINFTGKVYFRFEGSVLALYNALRRKQKVSYAGLIQTDYGVVMSLSPELFFRRQGNRMLVRPMKGTAPRGRTLDEDKECAHLLSVDTKSRAENIMIVDILRNDLGRISDIGSVRATSLCTVEKYETLFQMVSTVESTLRDEVSYYDIFRALFPSGSVTGAPKIRAMQLIHQLEGNSRGVYTGAIGYISPKKEAVFNVAIRTITLKNNHGKMGTGGGIVWDSQPEQEYNECLLKAKFLTTPHEEFLLIETMLWDNGFPFLEKHLQRLRKSAEYFSFCYDEQKTRRLFSETEKSFIIGRLYKVRMLLDERGNVSLENSPLEKEENGKVARVCLSAHRTYSQDRFLYHKTTRRKLYDKMYRIASQKGYADVIFLNENECITEGSVSNVFIEKEGRLITPPLLCGLLNGVYRQHMLETKTNVIEREITLPDVRQADAVYICNAVRGIRKVELVEEFLYSENRV